MFWDISSNKQKKNKKKHVTFPRPKGSLLTRINKLKTAQATERFLRDTLMETKTHKVMQDSNIYYEK